MKLLGITLLAWIACVVEAKEFNSPAGTIDVTADGVKVDNKINGDELDFPVSGGQVEYLNNDGVHHGGFQVTGADTTIYGDEHGMVIQYSNSATVYDMPTGKKFEVPGGQVAFDGKGGYKIAGSGLTIYGDENSLVVNAPGQGVELIDNNTGEYLDVAGGTLDMDEFTDQYTIISPDKTVFGSKLGVVVVNDDDSAYWLNAETGESEPIPNAKMTIQGDGGYSVIGTGLSIYGDHYGDIGETSAGVIFYSAVTGELINVPDGTITFDDNGSWKVHGHRVTIVGKADGQFTVDGSPAHGQRKNTTSKIFIGIFAIVGVVAFAVSSVSGFKSYKKRQARKTTAENLWTVESNDDIEPYRDIIDDFIDAGRMT